MTTDDWVCPVCGNVMTKISDKYITCLAGHTRLFNCWSVNDLPEAYHFVGNSKKFMIKGHAGTYKKVKGIKEEALGRCPPQGFVIAKVLLRNKFKARLFEPVLPRL